MVSSVPLIVYSVCNQYNYEDVTFKVIKSMKFDGVGGDGDVWHQ